MGPNRQRAIIGVLVLACGLLVDIVAGFGVCFVELDFAVMISLGFGLVMLPFILAMILPDIWYLLPLLTLMTAPLPPLLFGEWMLSGLLICFAGLGSMTSFLGASIEGGPEKPRAALNRGWKTFKDSM